jgi:hypothetical protein
VVTMTEIEPLLRYAYIIMMPNRVHRCKKKKEEGFFVLSCCFNTNIHSQKEEEYCHVVLMQTYIYEKKKNTVMLFQYKQKTLSYCFNTNIYLRKKNILSCFNPKTHLWKGGGWEDEEEGFFVLSCCFNTNIHYEEDDDDGMMMVMVMMVVMIMLMSLTCLCASHRRIKVRPRTLIIKWDRLDWMKTFICRKEEKKKGWSKSVMNTGGVFMLDASKARRRAHRLGTQTLNQPNVVTYVAYRTHSVSMLHVLGVSWWEVYKCLKFACIKFGRIAKKRLTKL